MFTDDSIAGSWDELVGRLDRRNALEVWARSEPVLRDVVSAAQLVAFTQVGADPDRADALLGALVRTGCTRGGDDGDAVLLVLHLLSSAVTTVAATLADLHPAVRHLIAGELAIAIRSFGVVGPRGGGIRRRAFAANLVLDARRAVLRELRPHCTPARPNATDILINPLDAERVSALFDRPVPGPEDALRQLDLADVLQWARLRRVAAEDDLQVLLAAEHARDRRRAGAGQRRIAAELGISVSTLRRRRRRALTALRTAHRDYLEHWLAA